MRRAASQAVAAALLLLAAAPREAAAGAWPMPEGEGLAITTFTFNDADKSYNSKGALVSGGGLRRFEASLYLEYGLTDRFTLVSQSTLTHRETDPPFSSTYTGLDYSELGLRALLAQGEGWVVSAQASGRLPGASDDRDPAQIGLTDPEADFRVMVGRSFEVEGAPAFAELQTGYRARFGDPSSEFRIDGTLGVEPAPDWLLLGQAFATVADGSAKGVFPDSSYLKLQAGVVHHFDERWSVQAGVFATVLGRDALFERAGFVSVWRRF